MLFTMNNKKIDEYRAKLEKERGLISQEMNVDSKPTDFGGDTDHYDEEVDEAEEFGNQLAAAQGLKERLNEIDIALAKIAEGKYGTCESCGKHIEEEILNIDPESRYCRTCKLERKAS